MQYCTFKSIRSLLIAIALGSMLTACGGGGGNSSETGITGADGTSPDNTAPDSNSPDLPKLELSWHMPDTREDGEDLEAY
jgi:hypothetical protein